MRDDEKLIDWGFLYNDPLSDEKNSQFFAEHLKDSVLIVRSAIKHIL